MERWTSAANVALWSFTSSDPTHKWMNTYDHSIHIHEVHDITGMTVDAWSGCHYGILTSIIFVSAALYIVVTVLRIMMTCKVEENYTDRYYE